MKLVVDTSVIIAVLANEPIKEKLINLTKGVELIAPSQFIGRLETLFQRC